LRVDERQRVKHWGGVKARDSRSKRDGLSDEGDRLRLLPSLNRWTTLCQPSLKSLKCASGDRFRQGMPCASRLWASC